MSRKTIYYHDPLHDDFAPTNGHIRPKPIGADFPYEHPSRSGRRSRSSSTG